MSNFLFNAKQALFLTILAAIGAFTFVTVGLIKLVGLIVRIMFSRVVQNLVWGAVIMGTAFEIAQFNNSSIFGWIVILGIATIINARQWQNPDPIKRAEAYANLQAVIEDFKAFLSRKPTAETVAADNGVVLFTDARDTFAEAHTTFGDIAAEAAKVRNEAANAVIEVSTDIVKKARARKPKFYPTNVDDTRQEDATKARDEAAQAIIDLANARAIANAAVTNAIVQRHAAGYSAKVANDVSNASVKAEDAVAKPGLRPTVAINPTKEELEAAETGKAGNGSGVTLIDLAKVKKTRAKRTPKKGDE